MIPFLGSFPIELWDLDVGPNHHHQPWCCGCDSFALQLHHAKVGCPPENHDTVDATQSSLSLGPCFLLVTHTTVGIMSAKQCKKYHQ